MIEKITFCNTPYETIRNWVYFDQDKLFELFETEEYKLFQSACIWGGPDKKEKGMLSWEFPIEMKDLFKEKFQDRENCKVDI